MYYEGTGPERGKKVTKEDAFSYACERCQCGSRQEQREFMEIAAEASDFDDFARTLEEWYYSGNWILVEEESIYGDVV